jgi:hypothetical protein
MRRLTTTTILQEDIRMQQEEISVEEEDKEEEEASKKMAKDNAGVVEADLGLLKNIEMKVRLERPNLSSLVMTTVLRVNLNE